MDRKRIPALEITLKEETYILDFNIESVKAFGNVSVANSGKVGDEIFLKFALQKNHKFDLMIGKRAKEIQDELAKLGEDDEMTYLDVFSHLVNLFSQAVDDAARMVEPVTAIIEKDNSVTVIINEEKHKLTFRRADVKDAVISGDSAFGLSNQLELYTAATSLLRLSTKHSNKRYSVAFHDNLFLGLWANNFIKETEHVLPDVVNALIYHAVEVIECGVKNSKPAIKLAFAMATEAENQLVL